MNNDPAATDNTAQDEPPLAPTIRPLFSEDGRAIFGYADAAVAEAIVQKLPIYFWKHEQICGLGKDNAQPNVGLMPNAFRRVRGLPANTPSCWPFQRASPAYQLPGAFAMQSAPRALMHAK